MGSVVFWAGRCLPVLLDALFATTANAETVISQLLSLDVVRDDVTFMHSFRQTKQSS